MMETYIGMITQFAYLRQNLMYWLPCNGQILDIKGHEALYSLIGHVYGGDGIHNFAIPDLRPKDERGVPLHLQIGEIYQGKPYIPYYICIQGLYPQFD